MRRMLAIPILSCGLALAAACSGSSDSDIPTANGSASAAPSETRSDPMAFVGCLREHGVNIPDPNPDIAWEQAEQSPAWDTASVACQHLAPPPPPGAQTLSTQDLEQLRAYAVCMRAHDIDMSDPDPTTGAMNIRGYTTKAQAENDPRRKAAHEACKDKLPASETGTK